MPFMMGLVKFLLRGLLRLLYRVEVSGMENYHKAGRRVLIVANHTSLLDGVLLYAWLPETPTFAINDEIASRRLFRPLLYFVALFEMNATNPLAIKSMIKYIKQDKKAVIFPEGRITTTGSLMKIYEGPGLIANKSGASILPVVFEGAQFSPFSYMRGTGHIRWFPKITLRVLPPEKISLPPELPGHKRRQAAAEQLQALMYRMVYSSFDQRQTLYSALLAAAGRFGSGHAPIMDFNRDRLSYRDLILRGILLGDLIKKQTGAGEYIGVMLPNVNALPVVFFALQLIGRVPAILNFTAGARAIRRALTAARIKVIYTSRRFIANAGLETLAAELARDYSVRYLEDFRKDIRLAQKLTAFLRSKFPAWHYRRQGVDIDPDGAAVILFTSGSEGHPKGVVLSHRNLLANYAQGRCHIGFNRADTVFCCLPLFHAFGLNAGLLIPLFAGGKTFLYPTPLHYRIIPELIYELQATILFGTNTFLKGYARYAHPFDFYSLKYIVAGAEKLREDTARLYMDKFGRHILQGYGVTEASPFISVNSPMCHKPGTVGRILPALESYLEPVAGIEQGGRLVVRGPNVMRGYLLHDKPGRIQPPATERGPGWYDTGDIVDIDEAGFITILGRARRFAKIGGEMVSLALVEELAMLTWPDIGQAAVAVPDERKGEKIILLTEHKAPARRALRDTARKTNMTELAIPHAIMPIDRIPVLGNGKTDYIALQKIAEKEDMDGGGS